MDADLHILSNATLALGIAVVHFVLMMVSIRLGRVFAPGAFFLMGLTWLRFSGRFAERADATGAFSLSSEWVIPANYLLLIVMYSGMAVEGWILDVQGRKEE